MKTNKLVSNRFGLLCILVLVLAFLGMTVKFVQLTDRAIVVLVGIDLNEGGNYVVSLQIIKPNGTETSASSSGDEYVVMTGEDKSFASAIKSIRDETGMQMALSHCYALVVSPEVAADENLISVLRCLIEEWKLPDRATLLCTEDEPAEVLKTKVLVSGMSGFYIQRAMTKNADDVNQYRTTVKDVMVSILGKSRSFLLPVADMILTDNDSNGSGSGSGGAANKGATSPALFSFERTAAVVCGKSVSFFGLDGTRAFSAVLQKSGRGGLTVTKDGVVAEYELRRVKSSTDFEDGVFSVKMKIYAELVEVRGRVENRSVVDFRDEFAPCVREYFENTVSQTFADAQQKDADIFALRDMAYRKYGRKWSDSEDFLQNVKLEVSVEISSTH